MNSGFPEFLELGNDHWWPNGEVFREIGVFRLQGFWGPGAQGPWGPGAPGVAYVNRTVHGIFDRTVKKSQKLQKSVQKNRNINKKRKTEM